MNWNEAEELMKTARNKKKGKPIGIIILHILLKRVKRMPFHTTQYAYMVIES